MTKRYLPRGGFSAILGTIIIVRWFTQNFVLLRILPSFEAMRFNTALGFSLAGVSLIATVFKRKTIFRVCGLIVGLIGVLTIIEYAFGVDLHIDQLFIKDTISITYPGRLALPTAIGFAFIGAAFILLGTSRWTKRQYIFLGIPGSIIVAMGVVGLIGFFSGLTTISIWGDFISMATDTAVGLLVLGVGLIASAWQHCANEERFLFQWLPVIMGVSVLTGTILLISVTLEWANIKYLVGVRSILPAVLLSSGVIVSFLLALVGYFGEKAQRRAKTAESANLNLEREIVARRRAEKELGRNYELLEHNTIELKRSNSELEREIAERKRFEDELERHAAELVRSNKELEQFASIASHDLQEPLRVVSGYLQLLARRYKCKQLDATAEEFINFAVEGATRMEENIKDLLDYSRVGSRHKIFKAVNCEDVLNRSLASLRHAIDEAGAVIMRDPLPTLTGDAFQLEHLCMNLVGNALKYHGENPPLIRISAVRRGNEWLFSVCDNGTGIDPMYFERIFDIFRRVERSKSQGTGIGLAICKKVIENHSGKIWVESALGEGSAFYFTIPDKKV